MRLNIFELLQNFVIFVSVFGAGKDLLGFKNIPVLYSFLTVLSLYIFVSFFIDQGTKEQ